MSVHHLTGLVTHPSPSSLVEVLVLALVGVCALYLLFRLSPTWIVTAGVVAEMFSGHWSNLGIPGPVDHFLLAFGLVSMLLGGRRMLAERRLVLRPVHLAILAIAAWTIASAIWAGTATTHDGFFALLDRLGLLPFTFFVVAPLLWGDAKRRSILAGALVAMGLYLGITALLEGVGLVRYTFPSYISDPNVGILFGRARGPYVESVSDGLGLIMAGIGAGIGLTIWNSRWARGVAVLVIALTSLGIVFTLTRAIWIAGALVVVIGVVAAPRLRRFAFPLLFGIAGLVATVVVAVPGLQSKAGARISTSRSIWDRENTNRAAISVVKHHPLTGLGWQRFLSDSIPYLRESGTYPLTGTHLEVHNVFLSHAAELGLPGCILWTVALLSVVIGPLVRSSPSELRPWRVGLLAYAVAFLVIANLGPLSYAQANLFMWVIAGVAGTEYLSKPQPGPARSAPEALLESVSPWLVRSLPMQALRFDACSGAQRGRR